MAKKLTTEEFIEKAKLVHGDKYNYSKSVYTSIKEKVVIICPEHGKFLQKPDKHLRGLGCPKCGKLKPKPRLTLDKFIANSRAKHGNKYNYSKVNVIDSKTKVVITCPIHGDFELTPSMHMSGQGCPLCGKIKASNSKSLSIEDFISKSKKVHGNKYDYLLITSIKGYRDKVPIKCSIHGVFYQLALSHYRGCGCPKCGRQLTIISKTKTYNTFIEELYLVSPCIEVLSLEYINTDTKIRVRCLKCNHVWEATPHSLLSGKGCPNCAKIHTTKLNTKSNELFITELNSINPNIIPLTKYVNDKTPIEYKCTICNTVHKATPNHLLRGHGCPKCNFEKRKLSQDEWINKARIVHSDKYDYSKVQYTKGKEDVIIICPIHGEFIQRADLHIMGRGCPKCTRSNGELLIASWLENNKINYRELVLINTANIARNSNLVYIDFVVDYDNKTYYIEYNGKQHYEYIPFFYKGGEIDFEKQQRRDNILREHCTKNNIILIEIRYDYSPQQINEILNGIFNI